MTGPSMRGFGKTLAGSVILHAGIIAALLFLVHERERVFIAPVMMVDLVSKEAGTGQAAPKPAPAPARDPAQARPAEDPAKARKEIKETAAKPQPESVKVHKKETVDDALKKIKTKVERRQDESLVQSRIEALKKSRKESEDRLARIKKELDSEIPKPQAPKEPERLPEKPAQASGGGQPGRPFESRYPAYFGIIKERVQSNWAFSEQIRDNRLSIIVSLKIARSGKLIEAAVEKSSGNARFDESLLKAVKKAAPFPPLPEDFDGGFLDTGLRFCPGCN